MVRCQLQHLSSMCIDMYIDMCIDMYIDMCIDMRIDMCIDMCTDMSIGMSVRSFGDGFGLPWQTGNAWLHAQHYYGSTSISTGLNTSLCLSIQRSTTRYGA